MFPNPISHFLTPKCTLTTFSLIIFLSSSSSNQFNRIWNNITISITNHKKMNMIRGDSVIQYWQDWQAITFFRFKKPLKPSSTILCKPEQKLSFITAVGDLPREMRNLFSLGYAISAPGYSVFSLSPLIIVNNALFAPKKLDIGLNKSDFTVVL